MSGLSILAVFSGAGVGALLRWWLALWLNPLWSTIPLGTVAANLGGGLLVGIAMATFEDTALPPEWRLLIITGFLGGLTTFSTFSGEVVTLLMKQQYGWAVSAAGLHLLGSVALTLVGIALANAVLLRA